MNRVRVIILGLCAAVITAACVLPTTAHAAALEHSITGIAGLSGHPVEGITPWATCQGLTQHAAHPTGADGRYLIIFAAHDCPIGSTATVRVYIHIAGGATYAGASQVVIAGEVTHHNIVAYDPVGVSEYGWIAGLAAIGGGVGTVIFVRKKRPERTYA